MFNIKWEKLRIILRNCKNVENIYRNFNDIAEKCEYQRSLKIKK